MIGGLQKVVHKRLYRDEPEAAARARPADLRLVALLPPAARPARAGEEAPGEATADLRGAPGASTTRPTGSCGRSRRPSPRRATRARPSPRSSTAPRPRSAPSTRTSPTRKRRCWPRSTRGSAQMLANTLPAFRRAQDWQHAVRGAYEEMFAFGVEEPEYSRLGAVEMYAAGKRALADAATRSWRASRRCSRRATSWRRRRRRSPPRRSAARSTRSSTTRSRPGGPESLPELVPMATYMTLAPVPRRRGGLRAGDRLGGAPASRAARARGAPPRRPGTA